MPEPTLGEIFQAVDSAMLNGERLEITYRFLAGAVEKRVVRPTQWQGGLHFLAFCELRQAERTFNIHRILAASNLGIPADS